jgi:hypothetical protein
MEDVCHASGLIPTFASLPGGILQIHSTGLMVATGGETLNGRQPRWHTSAANLKFLSVVRRVRYRNVKFKAALELLSLRELL